MAFRKSYVRIAEEAVDKKEKDIMEYPLAKNDFKEDINFEDIGFENTRDESKDIELKSDHIEFRDNKKMNDNLLKFIEDIVIKNLKRNKVESSNSRANDQNLKILEAKNKISLKSKAIKKKTKTPLKKTDKKIEKKIALKAPLNWIYLK